jgi:HlyD family secretion protein
MKNSYLFLLLGLVVVYGCNRTNKIADAYGNFEATEITVSAEANGKIISLDLEEGLAYDSGKMVGAIDSIDLVLKKQQLENQLKALESKRLNLNAQLDVYKQQRSNTMVDKLRVERMLQDGSATQKQMDDILSNLRLVEKQELLVNSQFVGLSSEVAALNSQIQQLVQSLKRCAIVNPVKGTVLARYAEQGELIAYGKPIYKVAALETMILKAYFSGDQMAMFKLGDKVKVFIDKNDTEKTELEGRVSWISSEAEFTPKIIQTKKERVNMVYAVKVAVANNGMLKIGMPGEVMLLTAENK